MYYIIIGVASAASISHLTVFYASCGFPFVYNLNMRVRGDFPAAILANSVFKFMLRKRKLAISHIIATSASFVSGIAFFGAG